MKVSPLLMSSALLLCFCQARKENEKETEEDSLQSVNSLDTTLAIENDSGAVCYSYPGWKDKDGDGCDWYFSNSWFCGEWGDLLAHPEDGSANQVCCECGGGYRTQDVPTWTPSAIPSHAPSMPSSSTPSPSLTITQNFNSTVIPTSYPSISEAPTVSDTNCEDVPGWQYNGNKCSKYEFWGNCPNKILVMEGFVDGFEGVSLDVSEACCICGGGSRLGSNSIYFQSPSPPPTNHNTTTTGTSDPNCNDIILDWETNIGWQDSRGQGCDVYAEASYCANFGSSEWNFGYTPNTACCTCGATSFTSGGGIYSNRTIVKEHIPREKYYGSSAVGMRGYQYCIDFPDWVDDSGNYNCTYFNTFSDPLAKDYLGFEKPIQKCESRGAFMSKNYIPANRACCGCLNSDAGPGGYNRTLIGKTLRVGIPADSENNFTLYTEANGVKNGSSVALLSLVAEATGFGLYEIEVSRDSKARYPLDTYAACVADLEVGNLDLCLGTFWKTKKGVYVSSDPLFTDVFYLVVPVSKVGFWSTLFTTFTAFSGTAWLSLLFVIMYMGLVLDIIQRGGIRNASYSWRQRLCSTFYHSTKTFVTRRMSKPSPKAGLPERFVTMAMIMFSLIVLTAYMASLAAALSTSFNKQKFTSLQDVVLASDINICIQERVFEDFVLSHPETDGMLVGQQANETTILSLMDEGECNTAVVTTNVYDQVSSNDNSFCQRNKILKDTPMLQVPNVVIMSTRLAAEPWGRDLEETLAYVIDKGYYRQYHKAHSLDRTSANGEACSEEKASGRLVLTPANLFGPLFLCSIVATAGLVLFYVEKERSKIKIKFDNMLSGSESGKRMCVALGIHSIEEEGEELRQTLSGLSPRELVERLRRNKVPDENIYDAIDYLPKKSHLVELAFATECSEQLKVQTKLESLKLSELLSLVKRCDPQDSKRYFASEEMISSPDNNSVRDDLYPLLDTLNDRADPRKKLINSIANDPSLLTRVMNQLDDDATAAKS